MATPHSTSNPNDSTDLLPPHHDETASAKSVTDPSPKPNPPPPTDPNVSNVTATTPSTGNPDDSTNLLPPDPPPCAKSATAKTAKPVKKQTKKRASNNASIKNIGKERNKNYLIYKLLRTPRITLKLKGLYLRRRQLIVFKQSKETKLYLLQR